MDESTLKRLGDKTMSPWYATLIGKLSWNGSLFTAKKMESNGLPGWQIVNKYIELSKKEGWEFPRKWGVR